MPSRRQSGSFWSNATVGANAYSDVARTGWGYDNFCIWISVDRATTITLTVANDVEDKDSDYFETTTSLFYPTFYLDTELKWTFSNADSLSYIIPDFAPMYARLKNSNNGAVITASWLALGD